MTSPRTLVHGRRVKKHTIVCGTPDFLEVVGACACIGTRPFLLPFEGPSTGYKASSYTRPQLNVSNMLVLF